MDCPMECFTAYFSKFSTTNVKIWVAREVYYEGVCKRVVHLPLKTAALGICVIKI